MCEQCHAPTAAQKQKRAEAKCAKKTLTEEAREYGVTALCREALQCQDPNMRGSVKVFTNAGRGYTVKWCSEVVYATQYLTQITTVKKLDCWIAELQTMARLATKQKRNAYAKRVSYAAETRRIESNFSSC